MQPNLSKSNDEHIPLEIEVLNELLDEYLLTEQYEICALLRDRLKKHNITTPPESAHRAISTNK